MASMPEALVLGRVCSKIGSGATPKGGREAYLPSGPFALIRSQNVLNSGFSNNGLAYINEEQAKALDGVAVELGDVLLNITGDSVARVCQAPKSVLPARVNQHVAIIRPRPDILNPSFLRYFLVSPEQQTLLMTLASSGATRNALTKGMIEQIEVPAVPIEEQKQIARILGSLDDRIDHNRALAAKLEAIARRLFKSWFVDFDPVRAKAAGEKPPGLADDLAALFPVQFVDSELGEIPEGWSVTTLGEAFDLNPRRALAKGVMAPYLDMANTPTTGHVPDQIIRRAFSSGSKFINGDTLLARITPCLENGKAAFVDFLEGNEVGWGSTEFIVMRPKARIPEYFGYLLVRHEPFKAHAIASMSGTSGRQRVQPDSLAAWELVLPSEAIAMAFGEIVEPLRAAIASANEENRVLGHIRDLLLPRLISGRLRVGEAEQAIADAMA